MGSISGLSASLGAQPTWPGTGHGTKEGWVAWPLGEIPHQPSPERCRQHLPEAGSLEAFLEEEAELSLKGSGGRVGPGGWGREERQGSKQSLRPFPRCWTQKCLLKCKSEGGNRGTCCDRHGPAGVQGLQGVTAPLSWPEWEPGTEPAARDRGHSFCAQSRLRTHLKLRPGQPAGSQPSVPRKKRAHSGRPLVSGVCLPRPHTHTRAREWQVLQAQAPGSNC